MGKLRVWHTCTVVRSSTWKEGRVEGRRRASNGKQRSSQLRRNIKGHAKDFRFYHVSSGEYSILKRGCTQHGEIYVFKCPFWGAWVAQSVKHLTSAQVMISWFVSSSPTWGSVLTAQSLEPVSDSVSPSLSAPPLLVLCLFLSHK